MQSFFLQQFELQQQQMHRFVDLVESNDQLLNSEVRHHLCHCINSHYCWNQRLFNRTIESSLWDDLPFYTWRKLIDENFLQTKNYLTHHSLDERISYTTADGLTVTVENKHVLFQILQHSNYHFALMNSFLKKNGLICVDVMSIDYFQS